MCIHITEICDRMVNMTLSVSEQIYKKMKKYTMIKWSDVARLAFEKKLIELELVNRLLKNSTFTEKDAEDIGHKIKRKIRKRLD